MKKKFIMISIVTMFIFSSGVIVNAKEDSSEKLDQYFTTEDILFAIITPRLDKIVKDQYGEEMTVNPLKVHDVSIIHKGVAEKGKDTEGWFQVKMAIMVGEQKPDDNFKMDVIVLKIDAPNIGGSAPHLVSDKIEGIQVELVKYYKHE